MAAKPFTAAEEALQKIQEQVTCGICLDSYKQPKLLKCVHVYCEQCLQRLVQGGAGLPCPQCRKVTPLPVGGVSDLQGAFVHNALLDIYKTLKNSGDRCPKHPEKEAEFSVKHVMSYSAAFACSLTIATTNGNICAPCFPSKRR